MKPPHGDKMDKVSYCIVTYNRLELLKEHLKALESQRSINKTFELQVIVCADHCTDGTNEFLANYIYDEIPFDLRYIILTGNDNKGEPFARNACIKQSYADKILIGDDDRIPSPDYVRLMIRDIKPGLVTLGNQDNWKSYPAKEQKIRPPDWREFVTGTAGVNKKDIYLVGGFDENLSDKWGFGDVDMGFRLHILGCRFKLIRSAIHQHKNDDYSVNPKTQDEKFSEAEENRSYLSNKFGVRFPPYDTLGRYYRYPNQLDLFGLMQTHNFLQQEDNNVT